MREIIPHCGRSDRGTHRALFAGVVPHGLLVGHHQAARGRRHLVRGDTGLREEVGVTVTSTRLVVPGGVAEWLGRGLQSPPPRFESGRRLQDAPINRSYRPARVMPWR